MPTATVRTTDESLHVLRDSTEGKDELWALFDEGRWYAGDLERQLFMKRMLMLETNWDVKIDVSPGSGENVWSSPCGQSHLLVEKRSIDEWRTQPHLFVEAAIVSEWEYSTEKDDNKQWVRVALWFGKDGELNMEPPLVRWHGYTVYQDRTLSVRCLKGGTLLESGKARFCKMSRVSILTNAVGREHEKVDAVAVVWKREDDMYAHEWEHVEALRTVVLIGSNRAARLIQRAWRKAVSDPKREVCQRRLRREFAEFESKT